MPETTERYCETAPISSKFSSHKGKGVQKLLLKMKNEAPIFFLEDDEEAERVVRNGLGDFWVLFVCLGFLFVWFFWLVMVVIMMMLMTLLFVFFFLGKKIKTSLAPVRQQLDINDRQNHYFLSPLLLR